MNLEKEEPVETYHGNIRENRSEVKTQIEEKKRETSIENGKFRNKDRNENSIRETDTVTKKGEHEKKEKCLKKESSEKIKIAQKEVDNVTKTGTNKGPAKIDGMKWGNEIKMGKEKKKESKDKHEKKKETEIKIVCEKKKETEKKENEMKIVCEKESRNPQEKKNQSKDKNEKKKENVVKVSENRNLFYKSETKKDTERKVNEEKKNQSKDKNE